MPVAGGSFQDRCRAAVEAMRHSLQDTLRPLVSGTRQVALLDFPEYGNVGDSAIWLGALSLLAEYGVRVGYAAGKSTYDPRILRKRLGGNGLILLSGGGNFGDLWPALQRFREQVVSDFPDVPVIQLPQSIHFDDAANFDRCRAVLNRHPALTLLVRDQRSLRLAKQSFTAPVRLCPDLAFALGSIPPPIAARHDITLLSRRDREASATVEPRDIDRVDWVDDPLDRWTTAGRLARNASKMLPIAGGPMDVWWMRRKAESRVRRGCRILASGRIVVTNRLHGHILCILLGQLHFVSDTAQGKLGAFYETWLRERLPEVWCNSEAGALARAREALTEDPWRTSLAL